MEKLRGKYEVILGFATLVVSLSAFKDELSKVHLELGYMSISLADYFLYTVYGFCICLYLYVVENIVRETKIGTWQIFNYAIWAAFIIFIFIILTPFFLIINVVVIKIYSLVTKKNVEDAASFFGGFSSILSAILAIISYLTTKKFYKEQKERMQESISAQEIIELDSAIRLYKDGYYSHSVLESFKVLETHLYRKVTNKDFRVARHNFNDIVQLALKGNIITEKELSSVNDLKAMRNVAAHSNADYTKQQAEFALDFVQKLVKRDI